MKALSVLAVVAAVLVGPVTVDAEAKPAIGLGFGGGINFSTRLGFGLGHGLGYGYGLGIGLSYGIGGSLGYGIGSGLGGGLGGGLGYSLSGGLGYGYGLGTRRYGGKFIGRRRREAEPTAGADPGFAAGHRNRHQESLTAILPPFGLGYGGLGYGGYGGYKLGSIGYLG